MLNHELLPIVPLNKTILKEHLPAADAITLPSDINDLEILKRGFLNA